MLTMYFSFPSIVSVIFCVVENGSTPLTSLTRGPDQCSENERRMQGNTAVKLFRIITSPQPYGKLE